MRGSALSFAVSRDELAAVFGADRLVTVGPDRLNTAVTHADSRVFLTEAGMPVVSPFLYEPTDCLSLGLPTAAAIQPSFASYEDVTPETAGSWVVLGSFHGERLYLDGVTGALRELVNGTIVNSGVDRFAR